MRLAFCGPSGTGKTTLAEYVRDRYHLEMNPVGARSVATAMGFDGKPYDVIKAGRYGEFQRRLLSDKAEWERSHDAFVTDRTTIDNLAYQSLHDIKGVDSDVLAEAIAGLARYEVIVLCPMSGFLDLAGDTARQADRAYHHIFDVLVEGLLVRHRMPNLVLWQADLDRRKRLMDGFF